MVMDGRFRNKGQNREGGKVAHFLILFLTISLRENSLVSSKKIHLISIYIELIVILSKLQNALMHIGESFRICSLKISFIVNLKECVFQILEA